MKLLREKEWWLLGAVITLFFHRPLSAETFFFRDLYVLFYPKRLFLVRALASGELPLWDPMTHGGQPYLGTLSNSLFHPGNLLYLVLPPLTAFNVAIVLMFVLCGWAAYALARVVSLSPWAAFATGAIYALCGFTLSSANLLVLLLGLPFVPATLVFTHKFAVEGKGRHLILAACCGAVTMAASAAEIWVVMAITIVVWVTTIPALAVSRKIAACALVIAFSAALSLIQILPAIEVVRNSSRSEKRTYADFSYWSVNPRRLPELVVPRFFGPTDTLAKSDYWGGRFEQGFPYILSIYFGAPVLVLAAFGALSRRIQMPAAQRLALAALAAVGLVASMGGNLPAFRLIHEYVPLIGIFRYPVKAIALSLIPIALLAGCGVEHVRAAISIRSIAVVGAVSVVLLAFGAALNLGESSLQRGFFGQSLNQASVGELFGTMLHTVCVTLIVTLLLALARLRGRDPAPLLALVIAGDLALAGARVNQFAPRELLAREPSLAGDVRGAIGEGRFWRPKEAAETVVRAPSNEGVWVVWWSVQLLRYYSAPLFGIPVIFHEDYDGLAPRATAEMTERVERMAWPERIGWLQKAAVSVFLAPDVLTDARVERIATVRNSDGSPLHVYRSRDAALIRFAGPCAAAVHLRQQSINARRVDVDAPCSGKLVFVETHYPGWRATVDGAPVPIERHEQIFSAVSVSRGRHVVEKRYRPLLPVLGAAGSLVSFALLLIVASRRRETGAPQRKA